MDCCKAFLTACARSGFYWAALEKYEELEQAEGEAALLPNSCCIVTEAHEFSTSHEPVSLIGTAAVRLLLCALDCQSQREGGE